jgi:hypothetical protein
LTDLSDLSPLAVTLNQKSDQINEVIAKFNAKLLSLNLGIELWVCTKDSGARIEDNSICQCRDFLGYALCGKERRWQLATRQESMTRANEHAEPVCEEIECATPLLSAARERRILALQNIDALLIQMKKEAERLIRSIDNAALAAEKL